MQGAFDIIRDVVFGVATLVFVRVLFTEGLRGLVGRSIRFLRLLPGVEIIVRYLLQRQARNVLMQLSSSGDSFEGKASQQEQQLCIPEKGKLAKWRETCSRPA